MAKPFYFYHIINKDANLDKGILSLQYMYDNKMYDLFDKSVEKYKYRIVNSWNLDKYKDRDEDSLSREEIIDALKLFRGEYGSKYIYFFRYPLYRGLGPKIDSLLDIKDIYQIDIEDEKTKSYIEDIFYGFDFSNSDNDELDRKYYEDISESDYFKTYDDTIAMNFSTLNHISISFKDGYCPIEILKKVEPK